ncbi:MAG: divalent-cation tolerance protein CutA [Thermoplasmata archaeon]|nr:divalent-cation tolerance protein CutA [Thermoplasmata archaeon]
MFPDAASARRIGDAAVARRLAACVNRFPIDSTYHWKGVLERGREVAAMFKTSPRKVGALFEYLARAHPYEVPDIFEIPVARAHRPYLDYLAETLEHGLPIPPDQVPGRRPVRRPGSPRGRGARALPRIRGRHRPPSRRTGRHR